MDTLDPEANSVNESIWLDQNLYSRLLQPNSTGTGLLPDLASSWTIASNGLTYTFHLRPDAKFSNGTPGDRERRRLLDPAVPRVRRRLGVPADPGEDHHRAGPHTVVITLSQPHAPLLADLAMYAYSVVPESLVKAQGSAFFQHPVGSGPFIGHLVQRRQRDRPGPQPVLLRDQAQDQQGQGPDRAQRQHPGAELESKKVDVIENPPGNLVSQINNTPGLSVQLFPSTRVDFVQLDEHFAPFKNQLVRQALNYAINRKAIVQLAYQGHATPGSSFMPYKMEFYDSSITAVPVRPGQGQATAGAGRATRTASTPS